MRRRPLPDSRARQERRFARVVSRLVVGVVVLGLVALVLYLAA